MSIRSMLGLAPRKPVPAPDHSPDVGKMVATKPKPPVKAKPVFKPLVVETPWYRLPVRSF